MEDNFIEVNAYILDENKKYIELDRLKNKNIDYLLLYEEDNINNITIRKVVGDFILYLEHEEFHDILSLFKEKNANLFN